MSERLQPGLHPDPDSLNAFIEGALPEHERLECVAHLAECAQCREVVYLAQEPLVVPAADRVSFWRKWLRPIPALSALAAAAAAAVLMLSVGIFRPEKPPNHSLVAMMPAPQAAPKEPPAVDAELTRKTMSEARHLAAPHAGSARVVSVGASAAPTPAAEAPQARLVAAQPPPVPAVPHQAEALLITVANSAPISVPTGIAGTITDLTGAVIAGATVTVHLVEGASNSVASADTKGQFHIEGIQPGKYEVKVVAMGFQSATKQIEVQKDHVAQADSKLAVGSAAETVEVTASARVASTETESVIEKKSVMAPLIGRVVQRKAAPATLSALPSNLAVVASVQKGKVMLALDTASALFVSQNSGQKWKAVKPAWQGKVARLETSGTAFRLITDGGAVWLSRNGAHWSTEKK
jgi:Carboxypeptidase regulatory-like domain